MVERGVLGRALGRLAGQPAFLSLSLSLSDEEEGDKWDGGGGGNSVKSDQKWEK